MTKTELQILANQAAIMHVLQVLAVALSRSQAVNELLEPYIERTKRLMQEAEAKAERDIRHFGEIPM